MPNIKSIWVNGANGQLGQSFQQLAMRYPQYDFVFADRACLDLSENSTIEAYFQQHSFDLMINCAAYTAVDKAEEEPELADAINHLAVQKLASIAAKQQAKFIHISTDYVFNGEQFRPYLETDKVDPKSVYGSTKLAGEQAVFNTMPLDALIIRTSWVYSPFANNFVKTVLQLGQQRDALTVIFDQLGSPTYAPDLAEAIMQIVANESFNQPDITTQLYHYSNEGACSWYDFSKAIFELSKMSCEVSPIETKDYPTAATRPHYSLLNKAKIKQQFTLDIPYWKDSLIRCLASLKEKE
ncbi:dTDP-4-dehydrorhamnose reductase [Cycloclasticus sp. 46_83_sub15_T18]|nr:dTDP-4-dehydrorhamnose reductase [Cycloclasticus sp. 46_83_sub15_T18]